MAGRKHDEYVLSVHVARVLSATTLRWTHVANEREGAKAGTHAKRMGVNRGVPDYLIFTRWLKTEPDFSMFDGDSIVVKPRQHPGVCTTAWVSKHLVPGSGLAIELKAGRGEQTKEQREWFAALEAEGWRCEVVRSIDEFVAILEGCYGSSIYGGVHEVV